MQIGKQLKQFGAAALSLLLILSMLAFPVYADGEIDAADDFETKLAAEGFPEDYKTKLRAIHKLYPNWQFKALHTGLDWTYVIDNEHNCRTRLNLVPNTSDYTSAKCPASCPNASYHLQGDTNWTAASRATIEKYMDPRNFMNTSEISALFQFELMSYDASIHTQSGTEGILSGTFMSNKTISYTNTSNTMVNTTDKYSDVIMQAAKTSKASPYYLASKIRQEIGVTQSKIVSGTVDGYVGYYNYYNIGAVDTKDPVAAGLLYAKGGTTGATSYNRPWTSPQKAILGGAQWIADGYINNGQDTGYLQKFQVNPNSGSALFTHQYMQNVYAAYNEGKMSYNAYVKDGTLSDTKVFSIPVFLNMGGDKVPATGVRITNLSDERTGYVSGLNTTNLNVRTGPGTSNSILQDNGSNVTLANNTPLTIVGMYKTTSTDNPIWYQARFTYNGKTLQGYMTAANVTLDSSMTVETGDTIQFGSSLVPSNSTSNVSWSSSNTSVGTIDASTGLFTAVKAGTTMITVTTSSEKINRCLVTVVAGIKATEVKISNIDDMRTGTVKVNDVNMNIRTGVGTSAGQLTHNGKNVTLGNGTKVTILGSYINSDANTSHPVWYRMQFVFEGVTMTGYGSAAYVDLDSAKTISVFETFTFAASMTPTNATSTYSWASSDPSVGTINASTGAFTPKAAGTTIITVTTSNNLIDRALVTVTKEVTATKIQFTGLQSRAGKTFDIDTNLKVRTGPGTSYSQLTSNGTNVTLSNNQAVTILSTWSVADASHPIWYEISFTFGGTVLTGYVSGSYVQADSSQQVESGQTHTFQYVLTPADATTDVTFSSENTSVGTIDSNGVFTAKQPGTTYITVKTSNGLIDRCLVTVTESTPKEYTVKGYVTSYLTAVGAEVVFSQNGTVVEKITLDASSAFSLTLLNGIYDVSVTKDGYFSFQIIGLPVYEHIDFDNSETYPAITLALKSADVDGDGMIGVSDLSLIMASGNFGKSVTQAINPECDLNGDGFINLDDVSILMMTCNYNRGNIQLNFS